MRTRRAIGLLVVICALGSGAVGGVLGTGVMEGARPAVRVAPRAGAHRRAVPRRVVPRRGTPRRGTPWWSDPASIRRGARDFATGSCISCHALGHISNADGAVALTHEGRRRSPAWLAHEIAHPTSDRPPTPPGQTYDLAAYLASLR